MSLEQRVVGLEDMCFKVGKPLIERALHEVIAIEHETVEDQIFDDGVIRVSVLDQFPVQNRCHMEFPKRLVFVVREMQALNVVVVVLPVDEVVDALSLVFAQIHQVAQAIGLFADIVVLIPEFSEVFSCEGDWLGARKGTIVASDEACDFILESVLELCTRPYASYTGDERIRVMRRLSSVVHHFRMEPCADREGGGYDG